MENSNPPIVSKETYEAAQTLMRSRKTESCKRKKYPLTGKLRCPDCGRTFRHQTVNGTAYWLCGGRSSGAENCRNRRVREDAVYAAFADMVMKLKTYRTELSGTLTRQMETMQNRTNRNQERIRQIDKEIADLGAKNLIITRMHTNGALDAAEYAGQTALIGNRITELRIERRKKLAEDENDAMIDSLKELYEILEEYEPTAEFDEALFNEIAESITVDSNAQLTFRLMGGIELTVPVVCPSCGSRMHRRHDSRCKCQERWTCKNKDCRLLIEMSDAKLLETLTALLGTAAPDGTEYHASAYEPSEKVRSLNNEISRMLDAPEIDKAALRSKMTECLAQKYSELGNECCTVRRLKAELSNTSDNIGRLNRTVREIRRHTDKTADILLLNGQTIGKEKDDGTDRNDPAESGASDRADRIG